MEAFYKTITWKRNFWEKLNLFMNRYSNYHGQSWARGLLFLFLSILLCYGAYLFASGIRFGSLANELHRDRFYRNLSLFFDFASPVHRSDELAKNLAIRLSNCSRFIEGASRILIGYGIYQMIQAFRKHGKK
ncbi:MAG: hypothetical protein EOO47_28500 [Flavobacterium sp.]|nr:MAG: hypothetical protein EOO47_28500 [Flavobacterium sp.]